MFDNDLYAVNTKSAAIRHLSVADISELQINEVFTIENVLCGALYKWLQ